jgi:hypothetical protein
MVRFQVFLSDGRSFYTNVAGHKAIRRGLAASDPLARFVIVEVTDGNDEQARTTYDVNVDQITMLENLI